MTRAAAAYEAARTEAEQHGIAGERATAQAQRAFVLAFTEPGRADDELALAQQLLTGLDLRATTRTTRIAASSATPEPTATSKTAHASCAPTSTPPDSPPRTRPSTSHSASTTAVRDNRHALATTIARLRERTHTGDYAYYADITHFMGGLPLPAPSPARWLDGEQETRTRWHTLVITRRDHLSSGHRSPRPEDQGRPPPHVRRWQTRTPP